MNGNRSLDAGKYTAISVSIIVGLVAMIYATMFGNYRPHTAIDNTWYLSFSYDYCIKGIDTDAVFGLHFPTGMGGTVAFGKLAAILQCSALSPFDWSLVAANVLSVAGVLLSVAAIFTFLVGEGFRRHSAATCCLTLAATEPFLAMANQSRYDYVTFFLAVCGLVLAARRHLFVAGLIAALAIEVEPIGIMASIYLITYELSKMIQMRPVRLEFDHVAKLTIGSAFGFAVYLMLHRDILALVASSSAAEWNLGSIHFLYAYFFQGRLYRHLPELAIFAACLLAHLWRRDYLHWPFPILASSVVFFIGFILRHHNVYYTPFWYFPSFLLVFVTISIAWRAVAFPALVLALFIPQYAVAYVWGHKFAYTRQAQLQVARSLITNRGADLRDAHIFGDFLFWAVFKDLSFEWAPTGKFNQPPGTSYLICGLDPPSISEESVCADELSYFSGMELVGQFSWARRKYQIYERRE
jgi:hypothetical protein